jgi:hypothetical protein
MGTPDRAHTVRVFSDIFGHFSMSFSDKNGQLTPWRGRGEVGAEVHMKRLLVFIAALLAGCVSIPYWERTWEGALTTRIIYVDFIAGSGDWDHVNGWASCDKVKRHCDLFIYSGAPNRKCTEEHELKHAAGFDHPRHSASLDCAIMPLFSR